MIHVITVDSEGILNMNSFDNIDEKDTSGNELAEQRFTDLIKEINESETEEEIENALEDGFYSYNGDNIYLVHSFPENIQN